MKNMTNFGIAVETAGLKCDGDITSMMANKFGLVIDDPGSLDRLVKSRLMTFTDGMVLSVPSASIRSQILSKGIKSGDIGFRRLYYETLEMSDKEIYQDEAVIKKLNEFIAVNTKSFLPEEGRIRAKRGIKPSSEEIENALEEIIKCKEFLGSSLQEKKERRLKERTNGSKHVRQCKFKNAGTFSDSLDLDVRSGNLMETLSVLSM